MTAAILCELNDQANAAALPMFEDRGTHAAFRSVAVCRLRPNPAERRASGTIEAPGTLGAVPSACNPVFWAFTLIGRTGCRGQLAEGQAWTCSRHVPQPPNGS